MCEKVILCVDDERIVLDSLKKQLSNYYGDQYLYEIAENADDAFEVIEELEDEGLKILIIVSDWLMPGLKGDEFLVKVHQRFPEIVKVMLTGQANNEAIERARRDADLFACIYKPWSEHELIDTINSGLNRL